MADWHSHRVFLLCPAPYVQIPLWPIGTWLLLTIRGFTCKFRFLYGRLAPAKPFVVELIMSRSDSSMADWHW